MTQAHLMRLFLVLAGIAAIGILGLFLFAWKREEATGDRWRKGLSLMITAGIQSTLMAWMLKESQEADIRHTCYMMVIEQGHEDIAIDQLWLRHLNRDLGRFVASLNEGPEQVSKGAQEALEAAFIALGTEEVHDTGGQGPMVPQEPPFAETRAARMFFMRMALLAKWKEHLEPGVSEKLSEDLSKDLEKLHQEWARRTRQGRQPGLRREDRLQAARLILAWEAGSSRREQPLPGQK